MRLNRYLAQAGFGSRRAVESLVAQGAVTINGQPADHPGRLVDEANDKVAVNGRAVKPPLAHAYILLNKPRGYDVTRGGRHHHRRAWDLLPPGTHTSVQSVGRLDRDSTGLLLFTNDGDLAFRLTHPRYGCLKIYEVEVDGRISPGVLEALRQGVELDDGPAKAVSAEIVGTGGGHTLLRIVMAEGRNRIVRRMCDAVGHPVINLNRTAVGPLALEGLGRGKTRELTKSEVKLLRTTVGLEKVSEPRKSQSPKKITHQKPKTAIRRKH
ncbi:rRNA pseudouridine synthase [bacterium]|nr:rRNA pseudouridine synthase [bacterium]